MRDDVGQEVRARAFFHVHSSGIYSAGDRAVRLPYMPSKGDLFLLRSKYHGDIYCVVDDVLKPKQEGGTSLPRILFRELPRMLFREVKVPVSSEGMPEMIQESRDPEGVFNDAGDDVRIFDAPGIVSTASNNTDEWAERLRKCSEEEVMRKVG